MVEDARRIVDSGTDRDPGAPYWGSDLDEQGEDERADEDDDYRPPFASFGGSTSNLPEGWSLLPTEQDLHARHLYRPTHSDAEGWYKLNAPGETSFGRGGAAAEKPEYDFDEEPLEADKIRFSQPGRREYYDEAYGSSDRAKRIRIIYGILLAAMSVPFFIQLMQQIASFLNFNR
jgi:hypothetical protein